MLPAPPPDPTNPHLAAALAAAGEHTAPEQVDQVWIFPPRAMGGRESGLAVLALFAEPDERGPRRTLHTLRYEAESLKGGRTRRTDSLVEEGTVPADRLDRIVDGMVRRLGGGMETPEVRNVAGDRARWRRVVDELASTLDPRNQE
ncbi:MAG: hypothetical protein M3P24_03255 [Gemmatimonadota bacterium]|nr:hypothetical protein [Gemmatimonadota bacterium]